MDRRVLETRDEIDQAAAELLPLFGGLSVLQAEVVLQEAIRLAKHRCVVGALSPIPSPAGSGPAPD